MKPTWQIGLDRYRFIEHLCISLELHEMSESIFFRLSFLNLTARISTLSKCLAPPPSSNDKMKLVIALQLAIRWHFQVNHGNRRNKEVFWRFDRRIATFLVSIYCPLHLSILYALSLVNGPPPKSCNYLKCYHHIL